MTATEKETIGGLLKRLERTKEGSIGPYDVECIHELCKRMRECIEIISDYAFHGSDYDYGDRARAFMLRQNGYK